MRCSLHGPYDDEVYARCPDCEVAERDEHIAAVSAVVYDLPDELEAKEERNVRGRRATPEEVTPGRWFLAMMGIPTLLDVEEPRLPLLTYGLALYMIGLHVALVVGTGGVGIRALAFDTGDPRLWMAFTAPMVHGSVDHLLGNTWFLLAFGAAVESRMPRVAMLVAYVAMGAAGSLTWWAFSTPGEIGLGASGAIAGLLGAALFIQPQASVTLGFAMWVFRVPMLLYAGLFLAKQLFGVTVGGGHVGWFAHLGGLFVGLLVGRAVNSLWPDGARDDWES